MTVMVAIQKYPLGNGHFPEAESWGGGEARKEEKGKEWVREWLC